MLLNLKAKTEKQLRESAERHRVSLDKHANELIVWALALLEENEARLAAEPMDSREQICHDPRVGWVTWDLEEYSTMDSGVNDAEAESKDGE